MNTDMTSTILPKSDQLNADDLLAGRSITIKITDVSIVMGDQPVALSYEGDNGKPYKPGKSMRRVLVSMWGPDAKVYIGRYLTLYRDDKVVFGGTQVGGIRISHMSHINEARTMALTASKAVRKPFTVNPLEVPQANNSQPPAATQTAPAEAPHAPTVLTAVDIEAAKAEARKGSVHMAAWWKQLGPAGQKRLVPIQADLKRISEDADASIGLEEIKF